MIPVLFHIGPITVYSFGLMMGIAFIVANYLFTLEIRRRGLPDELAGTVTLIALIGGVVGAKLFSLVENFDKLIDPNGNPISEIFSPSGLTFYGGLIIATLSIYIYLRRKKIPFLRVADAAAPTLIIAYGIGRIGCQLAGDGDYGIPSKLPWAMAYPHGTVPTNAMMPDSTGAMKLTELGTMYSQMFPGETVPPQVPVHPAPVYETLMAFAIFGMLWYLRKKPMAAGMLFAIYLIGAGLERLLVEFIRLNPLYLGLSQAQWISVGLILLGSMMIVRLRAMPIDDLVAPTPAGKPVSARARAAR